MTVETLQPSAQLPIAKPLLPKAAAIVPYLDRIDAARIYSNYGPLCFELEARLASLAGRDKSLCVTGANATLVLSAALMALARPGSDLCIMPSWTFCATAHAARTAGLIPYFVDVDEATWQITTEGVERSQCPKARVAAVIVVAPFGMPVDLAPWEAFAERTGIPVLIDAAAAMGNQAYGRVPVVVSLHPTKSLAAGEGAFLVAPDAELADKVRARLNFGFAKTRIARYSGFNGKMSEYGAAVALAALDQWTDTQAQWRSRLRAYGMAFAGRSDIAIANAAGLYGELITSTLVVKTVGATRLAAHLRRFGIDTRRWWNEGCHVEPAFAHCPHDPLPITEALAAKSLGLPFFRDMTDHDISRVAEATIRHN